MTHFRVVVVGDDPEGQLAKYDENMCVEKYRVNVPLTDVIEALSAYKDRGPRGKERLKGIVDPDELVIMANTGESTIVDGGGKVLQPTAPEVVRIYAWYTDQELHHDASGYYVYSTYNPNSKWDWYTLGGRFRGHFPMKYVLCFPKDIVRGEVHYMETAAHGGKPKDMDLRCDRLRRVDLDINYYRSERDEDRKAFQRYWEIRSRHPTAQAWSKVVESVGGFDPSDEDEMAKRFQQAQEIYSAQPILKKLQIAFGPFGQSMDDFGEDEAAYMRKSALIRCTPYAFVRKGEWHAPGDMGLFGIRTDGAEDFAKHAVAYHAMLDELAGDILLSIYDCHI